MARSALPGPVEKVRELCLHHPEAVEKPFGGHRAPSFRVRDKLFTMVSEDLTTVTLKAPPGVQELLVGSVPERFFVPRYVGSRGWVGIRLGAVSDWTEVEELIEESYRLIAPKRLVARLDSPSDAGSP